MGCHKGRNRKAVKAKQSLPVKDYIPTVTKRVEKVQRFANGDVECKAWGDRAVCIVRGVRHQEKCAGAACPANL